MKCPSCATPSLVETMAKGGVLIDSCKTCKGVWLDRGEVFLFSRKPRQLEELLELDAEGPGRQTGSVRDAASHLEEVSFLRPDLKVDRCPECEGYWFDAGELQKAMEADRNTFQLEAEDWERLDDGGHPWATRRSTPPGRSATSAPTTACATSPPGCCPLPNLFIRSAGVLFLLYGILGLVLIALAELRLITPGIAVAIGAGIIILQFVFGPWLMDLSLRWIYKFSWVTLDQLPEHLREFVDAGGGRAGHEGALVRPDPRRGAQCLHLRAPSQQHADRDHPGDPRPARARGGRGGRGPRDRPRQELGHAADDGRPARPALALLRLPDGHPGGRPGEGQRVPDRRGRRGVCPLHRQRVHRALVQPVPRVLRRSVRRPGDRQPQRSGLGPGQDRLRPGGARPVPSAEDDANGRRARRAKEEESRTPALDAIGAMGIFDRKSAVAMVATSAAVGYDRSGCGDTATSPAVSKENLKSAMQWDLWNPWATFYELSSTHPLVAHRLQYLERPGGGDGRGALHRLRPPQARVVLGRVRGRRRRDVPAALLFLLGPVWRLVALGGAAAFGILPACGASAPTGVLALVGLPVLGLGIGSLIKTMLVYRGDYFAPLSVAGLLHKVKVSNVRPVPARMRGTIIGRGVPGLIWSEDFVMRDSTGILFLDYRQPLQHLGVAFRAVPRR